MMSRVKYGNFLRQVQNDVESEIRFKSAGRLTFFGEPWTPGDPTTFRSGVFCTPGTSFECVKRKRPRSGAWTNTEILGSEIANRY
jgi:hypothetical protein